MRTEPHGVGSLLLAATWTEHKFSFWILGLRYQFFVITTGLFWLLTADNVERREGSALIMHGSNECVQQQWQQLCLARRRQDLFQKIVVALEKLEAVFSRVFDFNQVARDLFRRRQSLGERPLERIVPKIRREAAEGLLDSRRAAQNVLAKGKRETRSTRRFTIKQIRQDSAEQFARARMKLSELPIETLNEFVHLERGGRAQRRHRFRSNAERRSADFYSNHIIQSGVAAALCHRAPN